MTKPYKLAVVIGRFQIFHNGHKGLIDHALSIADHVLVIIGSANESRTQRNPFTAIERHEQIYSVYPTAPIAYHYQDDNADNIVWATQVSRMIDQARVSYGALRAKTALVGHRKDETSFYLDLFPEYRFVSHDPVYSLNSTDLRKILFGMEVWKFTTLAESVPAPVYRWLIDWIMLPKATEVRSHRIVGTSVSQVVTDGLEEPLFDEKGPVNEAARRIVWDGTH